MLSKLRLLRLKLVPWGLPSVAMTTLVFALMLYPLKQCFGQWSLGLNYPGISVRKDYTTGISPELRLNYADNIVILNPRVSYLFRSSPLRKGDSGGYQFAGFRPYMGLDTGFISFRGEKSEGTGYLAAVFAGLEYNWTARFGLNADLGYGFIGLKDDKTGLSTGGSDLTLNVGLYYRFLPGARSSASEDSGPGVFPEAIKSPDLEALLRSKFREDEKREKVSRFFSEYERQKAAGNTARAAEIIEALLKLDPENTRALKIKNGKE